MCKDKINHRTEKEDNAIHAMRRWLVSPTDSGSIDKTYLFNLALLIGKFFVPLAVEHLLFSRSTSQKLSPAPADGQDDTINEARLDTIDALEVHLYDEQQYGAVNWSFLKKILTALIKDVLPNLIDEWTTNTDAAEDVAETSNDQTTPDNSAANDTAK